jgi:hypothetical protein
MIICFVITIFCILSIELALSWNKVSGVYDVGSTGQVIPLIVGLSLVINVFWKLSSDEVCSTCLI